MMNIGKRIIYLREQLNLSQKDLADEVKINVSVMHRIESGERPLRDSEIITIANVLNVTTDCLLGVSDTQKSNYVKPFNNQSLQEWYDELLYCKEPDVQRLREIWEIMNRK